MKYNERDRHTSDKMSIVRSSLRSNPLLTGAVGATCIAGACVSLSNALVLIAILAFLLPVVGVLSSAQGEHFGSLIRPAFYCVVSGVIVFLISLFIDNVIADGSVLRLGIYAPLLAVDGLVMARTDEDSPILTARESLTDSFTVLACAAFVALPVGIIRELLITGRLFSRVAQTDSPFARPFFGFLLCGFMLALLRVISEKIIKEDV